MGGDDFGMMLADILMVFVFVHSLFTTGANGQSVGSWAGHD